MIMQKAPPLNEARKWRQCFSSLLSHGLEWSAQHVPAVGAARRTSVTKRFDSAGAGSKRIHLDDTYNSKHYGIEELGQQARRKSRQEAVVGGNGAFIQAATQLGSRYWRPPTVRCHHYAQNSQLKVVTTTTDIKQPSKSALKTNRRNPRRLLRPGSSSSRSRDIQRKAGW